MPSLIENRESYIHDRILQDLIAAHLQAMSVIPSSVEVQDMSISAPDRTGLRTITYKTFKTKAVELIVHTSSKDQVNELCTN